MHEVIIFLNSLNFFYTFLIQGCNFCLLVCFFVWSLSPHSRIYHSLEDVTISGEGLHIFTYARHLWPLSSEGSFACHTYYDTGRPFIMVISENPWHTPIAERLAGELSLPVLTTYICRGWNSNTQPSACGANALTHCDTAAACNFLHIMYV